jgi:Leucine-rich repeat (LRR) protein
LRHIPKELARLPQLKELHIQQNQLNVLPPAIGKLDLGNVKHIYRFEPNPFIPELALQMSNLTRLANYLKSDEYREIYQNYFLNFDDNETKEETKKTTKKNKTVMIKNK